MINDCVRNKSFVLESTTWRTCPTWDWRLVISAYMGMVVKWSWQASNIIPGKTYGIILKCYCEGRKLSYRLEDLYERAEEKANELHMTHELLDEWKRQGDELLYSMIPRTIAENLRRGKESVDTCKVSCL